jgi:hypothetical protein
MWQKLKRKIKGKFTRSINNTWLQFRAYPSYWHAVLHKGPADEAVRRTHYLSQQPNQGAGIGHQLANWNAGLYFSGYFGLNFAHFPFSTPSWENFLGFGVGEPAVRDLLARGYKKVRLPKFDSNNPAHLEKIRTIIGSYDRKNIVFSLEHDQGYLPQFHTAGILQKKFFAAPGRNADRLIYSPEAFNIAVHIRRGDVAAMRATGHANWAERWLDDNYYLTLLQKSLPIVKRNNDKVHLYLFSQGKAADFPEFAQFENLHFCLDMSAIDSFLHLVNADLVISSKSSFSYKPALISKGIKICPALFWHGYPDTPDFILADNEGGFDGNALGDALREKFSSITH